MTTEHRAYIAGPMTGIPQFNFPAFDECRDYLLSLDTFHVISPADMDRADGFDETECTGNEPLTDKQKQRFARNDIHALLNVDMIVLLPGWQGSTGATNESKIAAWLGLDGWEYLPDAPRRQRGRRIVLDGSWAGKEMVPLAAPSAVQVSRQLNPRAEILLGAEALVNGDRNVQYGNPNADFLRTATYWNEHIKGVASRKQIELTDNVLDPWDVGIMMMLLKVSRLAWTPTKADSYMDAAGYSACAFDCANNEAVA